MLSWQPLLPWFFKLILIFGHSFKGAHAGCCLWLLLAAAGCCLLLLAAACCCCLLLLLAAAACYCFFLPASCPLLAGCLLAAACCCLLTSYRPRIGPRINAPLSTTVFDMQPFCPNLTCESGVPVWIKTHCAWDSGRSSLEKRSSHGDLLRWFGQVWSISKREVAVR